MRLKIEVVENMRQAKVKLVELMEKGYKIDTFQNKATRKNFVIQFITKSGFHVKSRGLRPDIINFGYFPSSIESDFAISRLRASRGKLKIQGVNQIGWE